MGEDLVEDAEVGMGGAAAGSSRRKFRSRVVRGVRGLGGTPARRRTMVNRSRMGLGMRNPGEGATEESSEGSKSGSVELESSCELGRSFSLFLGFVLPSFSFDWQTII